MSDPTPLGDEIRGMKTRKHQCGGDGCAVIVEQTYFMHHWTPRTCPDCAAKERERSRMTKDERTKVEREQAGKAALTNLRVPRLYADVSLETFKFHGTPEDQRLQRFAVGFGLDYIERWPNVGEDRMLVTLRGEYGTGKGHWTWSVLKAIATEHAAAVAFVRLPDLIREIRASWRDNSASSEIEVLNKYRNKDLLAVDEVSRHAFYGQGFQHLLDVIDHRVNNQRTTILTTNDTDTVLGEILGGANMSRLNGCGGMVEFGNADWRSRDRGEEAA
jgi:DNA replication protein DnaC